jgi:drug/metabolite transporter (DMT)-like permease
MGKLILILAVSLCFEAVGVVFLSKGLKQIGEISQVSAAEIGRLIGRGVTNPNILLGVFFEACFFGGLLLLMSRSDVSFIWPLTSLGFVLTTLAAKYVLHEEVPLTRWAGVFLIVAGAALITWSEKVKRAPVAEAPALSQSAVERDRSL